MDPISIIITAIVLGQAAGLKPVAEQAIIDSYADIKAPIQQSNINATLKSIPNRRLSVIRFRMC
jgi:hypothetical protein